jgi:hypothetical protein
MPVPKEIREIERPVNTIVYAYGKNKDKYAVKQRVGCKRKNGGNYPVNGPTIGHIIDGKYVPLEPVSSVSFSDTALKDWGSYQLCCDLSADLLEELQSFYNFKDAARILVIAILRVCSPGVTISSLKETYEDSFLTELFPDTAVEHHFRPAENIKLFLQVF